MLWRTEVEEYINVDTAVNELVNLGQRYSLFPALKYMNLDLLRSDTRKLIDRVFTHLYERDWTSANEEDWCAASDFLSDIHDMWYPTGETRKIMILLPK